MSNFENLCTEYRENKRLIEELTAMNEDIKAHIIALMGDRETVVEGSDKSQRLKPLQAPDLTARA